MGKRIALLSAATLLAAASFGAFLVAPEEIQAQTRQYLGPCLQQAQVHFSFVSKMARSTFDEVVEVTKFQSIRCYNDVLVPNFRAASIQVKQTTSQVQAYLHQVFNEVIVPNFQVVSTKFRSMLDRAYPVFQGFLERHQDSFIYLRKWTEDVVTRGQQIYSTTSAKERAFYGSILLLIVLLAAFWRRRHGKSVQAETLPVAPTVHTPVSAPLAARSTMRRSRAESPAPRSANNENARPTTDVNSDLLHRLNTSTKEELDNVNGLGGKSIEMLLKFRGKQGELHSFEDLVNVPAKLQNCLELAVVS